MPDVSATTIENVVAQMLKQGKIKKIGTFKDAKSMLMQSILKSEKQ